jgi:hypothetical protein
MSFCFCNDAGFPTLNVLPKRSEISSCPVAVGHIHETKTTNRSFYADLFDCRRIKIDLCQPHVDLYSHSSSLPREHSLHL